MDAPEGQASDPLFTRVLPSLHHPHPSLENAPPTGRGCGWGSRLVCSCLAGEEGPGPGLRGGGGLSKVWEIPLQHASVPRPISFVLPACYVCGGGGGAWGGVVRVACLSRRSHRQRWVPLAMDLQIWPLAGPMTEMESATGKQFVFSLGTHSCGGGRIRKGKQRGFGIIGQSGRPHVTHPKWGWHPLPLPALSLIVDGQFDCGTPPPPAPLPCNT